MKTRPFDLKEPPQNVDHLSYQLLDRHLRVWRTDEQDGITWDELQVVKNEACGIHACCIEIYPPQSEMLYYKNIRHLWIVDPESVPSLLKTGRTSYGH